MAKPKKKKIKIVRIWDGGEGFLTDADEMAADFNRAARRKGVRYASVPVHPYGNPDNEAQEVEVLYRAPRKAKDEEVSAAANETLKKEWEGSGM
jgi:hypothetical protein